MNENNPKKELWWHRLEAGQAMAEYWPTIPAAIAIMIVAGALASSIGHVFHQTADTLNMVVCGDAPPAYFTMPIGQAVEILGTDYDSKHDRSTFTLSVPGDSQVLLGFSEEDAARIDQSSDSYVDYHQDSTTGQWGISFDGDKSVKTSDTREITLTLSGGVDFVNYLPVTVIDDSGHYTSGIVYATITSTGEDCANQSSKTWGNNGVGNGYDDQPPGQPPENDTCADAAPGSPCNKGGANKGDNKNKV